uniref:DUF1907 domain-containing protein n=1 Tax=Rhodosorus marinus TaxID=101924 RepID=A0A7S0BJ12_9RHOD|mmetsp:Transcript_18474/g.26838  ORF Transcript_18474/g.26838 Transcript_18474/m.26838 type:complete len:322 (+) Transcript_18474:27-992(+)
MIRCDELLPLYTERMPLDVPSLTELQEGLEEQLKENYESVDVSVEECVDLTLWGLAFPGLCGSESLVDVGGVPNLLDPAFQRLAYPIEEICVCAGVPNGCALGATAADANFVGKNAELIPCESVGDRSRTTQTAMLDDDDERPELIAYDHGRIGCLGNLFISEGKPGRVLKIRVAKRSERSKGDFVAVLQNCLVKAFPTKHIGLGGVFRLDSGAVKAHIMPDFKKTVMIDGPEVESWLKFFEFGPGGTFLSTLLSSDPSDGQLNLRLSHTHFFNTATGEGGHYHNDTTPKDSQYTAYFMPAKYIYRVENAFDRSRCLVKVD